MIQQTLEEFKLITLVLELERVPDSLQQLDLLFRSQPIGFEGQKVNFDVRGCSFVGLVGLDKCFTLATFDVNYFSFAYHSVKEKWG